MWAQPLIPAVPVGVIGHLAPPCSLCFPLYPQIIAAAAWMLVCVHLLQSLPSSHGRPHGCRQRGAAAQRGTCVQDRQSPRHWA